MILAWIAQQHRARNALIEGRKDSSTRQSRLGANDHLWILARDAEHPLRAYEGKSFVFGRDKTVAVAAVASIVFLSRVLRLCSFSMGTPRGIHLLKRHALTMASTRAIHDCLHDQDAPDVAGAASHGPSSTTVDALHGEVVDDQRDHAPASEHEPATEGDLASKGFDGLQAASEVGHERRLLHDLRETVQGSSLSTYRRTMRRLRSSKPVAFSTSARMPTRSTASALPACSRAFVVSRSA